eukprot:Clim_evm3s55 gene=Clim_evmTU3s55
MPTKKQTKKPPPLVRRRSLSWKPDPGTQENDIVVVELFEDSGFFETQHFRLYKNDTLRFRLAPQLQGHAVKVETNYPLSGEPFDREAFRIIDWDYLSVYGKTFDTGDRQSDLELWCDGAFEFQFSWSDDGKAKMIHCYFMVEPLLKNAQGGIVPLDSISIQTVISKLLGPVTEWKDRLEASVQAGYNMIHFTPVQELGASGSAYSLADQTSLEPRIFGENKGKHYTLLENALGYLEENGVLAIVDMVWNHTADNSTWLLDHPEAGYNLENSPHLLPAYAIDEAIGRFSRDIGDEIYDDIKPAVTHWQDIERIKEKMRDIVLPGLKLWEFFVIDVDSCLDEFMTIRKKSSKQQNGTVEGDVYIVRRNYQRNSATINMEVAISTYAQLSDEEAEAALRQKIEELNLIEYQRSNSICESVVDSLGGTMSWERLDPNGPKRGSISRACPLAPVYFTRLSNSKYDNAPDSDVVKGINGRYILANNGWVMNIDPLRDFASKDFEVYVRREVIIWGDCVKLRYGKCRGDNPWLWDHMAQYTVDMAKRFNGFRIDNCHSTPLPLAEYMLDKARNVRTDLYVMAELFTGSEQTDNRFVNRLGLASLIREAMQVPNCRELGRVVHRYGGKPLGSFMTPSPRTFKPSIAHALFMDCTHDNQTPFQKRSVLDYLPNAAVSAMICCAYGSTRGYDELTAKNPEVVQEWRSYMSWGKQAKQMSMHTGIVRARKVLNDLHVLMGKRGFSTIYIDQMTDEVLTVTRQSVDTHESYLLYIKSAFSREHTQDDGHAPDLFIPGKVVGIELEGRINPDPDREFVEDQDVLLGLHHGAYIAENIQITESRYCTAEPAGQQTKIWFQDFQPGTIVLFRIELNTPLEDLEAMHNYMHLTKVSGGRGLRYSNQCPTGLALALKDIPYTGLNRLLYRCAEEEGSGPCAGGAYDIPGDGPVIYCGLEGLESRMQPIREENNLGHALCANIRDGPWLMDWVVSRLCGVNETRKIGEWIGEGIRQIKLLPSYLHPAYFDSLLRIAYAETVSQVYSRMPNYVAEGDAFSQRLALTSVQLYGEVQGAELMKAQIQAKVGNKPVLNGSIAAGLSHFSTGYMRCWGRDTFICLRGLFLVTGRSDEAKDTILAFASCLRHGLIPNLLDGCENPRFNCRDAVWWWMQAIQDYCTLVEGGEHILKEKVTRLFPTDDQDECNEWSGELPVMSLSEVMQEALQKHAWGISFREWNAGTTIDDRMTDKGFKVDVRFEEETGMVYGGNDMNCGTWMDKLGESTRAGNRGIPATPRDGADVEIIGLLKSTTRWLAQMSAKRMYPFDGVTIGSGSTKLSFKEWDSKLQKSFEHKFYVPENDKDDHRYDVQTDLVHRRGIYKDTVGSHSGYTDYQLRPNFFVAMAVAPEMFDHDHARRALAIGAGELLGPLGVKTLDSRDWKYRGNYENSIDSDEYESSKGFNYHQGPEWLWPLGYYLRALLIFDGKNDLKRTVSRIERLTANHKNHIRRDPWRGLPELTNANGAYCAESCTTQAWSMATLLDTLYDIVQRSSGG